MIFEIIGLTASIVGALGYVLYAWSIYKRRSRPSRMTWFILTGLATIIAVTNFELEATVTMGVLVVGAVGSAVIFLLSIPYGDGGWDRNDKVALGGLMLAVIVWLLTNNPFTALFLALSFDFWGLYPTILKVWSRPETEEFLPWGVTVLASVLNVLALDVLSVNAWSLDVALTPVYFLLINGVVLLFIVRPRLHRIIQQRISRQ